MALFEKRKEKTVIELPCNERHEVKLDSIMSFQDMISWVLHVVSYV